MACILFDFLISTTGSPTKGASNGLNTGRVVTGLP